MILLMYFFLKEIPGLESYLGPICGIPLHSQEQIVASSTPFPQSCQLIQ